MPSVTRQSLRFKCSVKDCPWPQDEEIHVPWCLGIPDVEHWADKPTHQHHPKKGMGGNNPKSKIVAILCPTCHDRIDNGDWGNKVDDVPWRGRMYYAWDLHGTTLIEREHPVGSLRASPSLSQEEESDGTDRGGASDMGIRMEPRSEDATLDGTPVLARGSTGGGRRNNTPSSLLTHEQRVAIAKEIKDAQQRRQFLAGDYANNWEEELGEDFWNLYANDFGYTYPSLRNVMRVCKQIPQDQRHDEMSFAHHEAVKTFDIETRDAWLERAHDEEWSVKRLREELVAEGLLKAKTKARKWALEQLQEAAIEWGARGPVQEFLEWLPQRS